MEEAEQPCRIPWCITRLSSGHTWHGQVIDCLNHIAYIVVWYREGVFPQVAAPDVEDVPPRERGLGVSVIDVGQQHLMHYKSSHIGATEFTYLYLSACCLGCKKEVVRGQEQTALDRREVGS
jgi:hypothetical protein